VGEDGVLLSGGQRQRIAIARALLRRPMLLVLDEPTNHLDEDSVRQLLHNLSARDNPPASLIISHDPVVVSVASHIYTLDEGLIVSSEPPLLTE
jgi:ABC-type bacteriocin/lantibiotic exporter with double-glycine peptidase domain